MTWLKFKFDILVGNWNILIHVKIRTDTFRHREHKPEDQNKKKNVIII